MSQKQHEVSHRSFSETQQGKEGCVRLADVEIGRMQKSFYMRNVESRTSIKVKRKTGSSSVKNIQKFSGDTINLGT